MRMEQIPDLDWPRDLYRGPVDQHATRRSTGDDFREDADDTAETEQISLGGGKSSIVCYRYGGRTRTTSAHDSAERGHTATGI